MFAAACKGAVSIIKEIISKGGSPNTLTSNGKPVLFAAVKNNQWESLRVLLDAGADPNLPSTAGENVLHCASWHTNPVMLKRLLKISSEEQKNACTIRGDTPLHYSVTAFSFTCTKILLENNADFLIVNNSGNSPYETLLAFHSEEHQVNNILRILEEYAKRRFRMDFRNSLEKFLKAGFGPKKMPKLWRNALLLAAREGDEKASKMLLEAGTRPGRKEIDSWLNPELEVSHAKRTMAISSLLTAGAHASPKKAVQAKSMGLNLIAQRMENALAIAKIRQST